MIFTRRFVAVGLTAALTLITSFGCAASGHWRSSSNQATLAQFVKIDWPSRGVLAEDGTFYFLKRQNGVRQLFSRRPGVATPENLTDFADGIGGYTPSFDDKWLAITAAPGGNEQFDIYLMDTATGKLQHTLVDPETVFGSVVWNRDSSAFAYRANKKDKANFNVYVYSIDTGISRIVWNEPGYWYPEDFSPDGSTLLIGEYRSASQSSLYEVPLNGSAPRSLTPVEGKWSFSAVGYSPDGKKVYVISNFHTDREQLFEIDRETLGIRPALPQLNQNELDGALLSKDRQNMAVVVNIDGYAKLRLYSVPDLNPLPLPTMDDGIVGNVRFVGDTLLFSMNNAKTPGTIYRWPMGETNTPPIAITTPDTQGIDVTEFRLPTLIRYRSDDGLEIPAFLYLPPGQKRGQAIPFIISFHGGPEGQYRPYFSAFYQYFLSRGYGILAPNVRGSSGYGTEYLEMDNYKKRMDSVKDGVAGARWLVDNGYSQPGLMAAYGGSYGGFMVMAVITQAPGLFGAACNYVGIVNFETFLQRTKSYRRKLREAEYGPLSDPEFLKSISPIYLVDRIRTPVFIAHGENDPRVPVYEARQLYDALESRGQTPQLLVFSDEGHGFRKEKNRLKFYQQLSDFLDDHLKK